MNNKKFITTDGNTAAANMAYSQTEMAFIYPITPSSGMAENIDSWSSKNKLNVFNRKVTLMEMQSEAGAAGALHGALTGGTEEYTDDEYRYLLMHWKEVNLKGSADAYEEYFANFDGIDSYKIVPCWDGTGTIKVILDPGTPEQLLRAYNDLQSKVTQMKEDITMFAPVSKPIDIYAVVNVDIDQLNPYSDVEKEKIKTRIISSIKVFIDGGYTTDDTYYPGLLLGEDFIPHKLAVFLDDEIPELKNINFNYPLDYVPILDEEIGVSNDITIEMI